MDCRRVQEQFSAFLDGELSTRQCQEIEAHLSTCATCRQELRVWEQLWEALLAEPVVAPPDLRERVLARLPRPRRLWWQNLALAASLLIGVFLGGRLGLEVHEALGGAQLQIEEVLADFEETPSHSLPALLATPDLENGDHS